MDTADTTSRITGGRQRMRPVRQRAGVVSPSPYEETLPFPPALHRLARASSPEAAARPGAPSLEQLTEAGLEQLRAERESGTSSPPPAVATDLTATPLAEEPPAPLSWRGRPLSEEFQGYAQRVARGEELEPYRGQVLADASLDFPWNTASKDSASKDSVSRDWAGSRPLRSQAPRRIALCLLALVVIAAVAGLAHEAPPPTGGEPVLVRMPPAQPAATSSAASDRPASAEASPAPAAADPLKGPEAVPNRSRAKLPAPVAPGSEGSPLLVEQPPF
jgi:hypothetical protein